MRYSFHGGLPPKKKTSADALVVSRHMLGNSSAANAEPISLPDKPLRDFSFDEIKDPESMSLGFLMHSTASIKRLGTDAKTVKSMQS